MDMDYCEVGERNFAVSKSKSALHFLFINPYQIMFYRKKKRDSLPEEEVRKDESDILEAKSDEEKSDSAAPTQTNLNATDESDAIDIASDSESETKLDSATKSENESEFSNNEKRNQLMADLTDALAAKIGEEILTEDEAEQAIQIFAQMIDDINSNHLSDSTATALQSAANYSRAIEEAHASGIAEGRNANIDEIISLKMGSDGLPHPGASGGGADMDAPSIFRLAREAR